jgi:hypothetical protein
VTVSNWRRCAPYGRWAADCEACEVHYHGRLTVARPSVCPACGGRLRFAISGRGWHLIVEIDESGPRGGAGA